MLTGEIKKKCDEFTDQNEEFKRYFKPAKIMGLIFGVFSITFLGSLGSSYEDFQYIDEITWGSGVISLISLIIAFVLIGVTYRYNLEGNQKIVLHSYNAFMIIDDYLHRSKFKPKLKKARKELQLVSNLVTKRWITFTEYNTLIANNVKGLTPFMKNMEEFPKAIDDVGKLPNFQIFLVDLMKLALEYGADDFESLNKKLKDFVTVNDTEPITMEDINKFFRKYPSLKYIPIPPIVTVIVFSILNFVDSTQTHYSLATALIIGAGATFSMFRDKFKFKSSK